MNKWTSIQGVLVQGYRVASGPSKDYPYGALDRQRPFFVSRGLDLGSYFNGTLILTAVQFEFAMMKLNLPSIMWSDGSASAGAFFIFTLQGDLQRCGIRRLGGIIRTETKLRSLSNPSLLEVIAMPIGRSSYGDKWMLW